MTLNFTHPNPKPGDPILASDEQIIRDTLRRLTGGVDAGSDDAAGVHHRQPESMRGFWARIHSQDSSDASVYELERIALKSDPEPVQVGSHRLSARASAGQQHLPLGLVVFVERLPVVIGFGGTAAYRFTVPDGQMEFPAKITASAESGLHSWVELQATAAGWQNHPDGRSGTLDARAFDGSRAVDDEVVLMVVRPNADSDWSPRFIRQPPTLAEGSNITIDESVSGGSLTLTINATGELTVNFTGDDWINVDLANETITHTGPGPKEHDLGSVTGMSLEMEDGVGGTPPYYEIPTLTIESEVHELDARGHVTLGSEGDRTTVTLDLVDALNECIIGDDDISVDVVGSGGNRKQLQISLVGSSGGYPGSGATGSASYWFSMLGYNGASIVYVTLSDEDWRGRIGTQTFSFNDSSTDYQPEHIDTEYWKNDHTPIGGSLHIPRGLLNGGLVNGKFYLGVVGNGVGILVDFEDGGKLKVGIAPYAGRIQLLWSAFWMEYPTSPTHTFP